MVFVALKPAYARRLAENLRDHAWLFRHAHRVEELEGAERLDAVSELTLGLSIAAFSPRVYREATWDKPKTIEEWLSYYRELLERNADSIRLVFDRDPIEFSAPGHHDHLGLFGRLRGFTQVVPLTDTGFERFTGSGSGITALTPRHVVPGSSCHSDQTNLYIGGVVDVGALNEPTIARHGLASPVLRELTQHIASFAPQLKWTGGDDTRLTTPTGGKLPRFCAFSGRDTRGWYLLEGSGFRLVEASRHSDAPKYVLDLNNWNLDQLDSIRRLEVRRAIGAFQQARKSTGKPQVELKLSTITSECDIPGGVAKRGDTRRQDDPELGNQGTETERIPALPNVSALGQQVVRERFEAMMAAHPARIGAILEAIARLEDQFDAETSATLSAKSIDSDTRAEIEARASLERSVALMSEHPSIVPEVLPDIAKVMQCVSGSPEILTRKQVAEEVGLSGERIKALTIDGRIGTFIGGQNLYTRKEIDHFKMIERKPGRPKSK